MRILWDLRLFSYMYANRGVGTYTKSLTEAAINKAEDNEIFVWAEREKIPDSMQNWPVKWIRYTPRTWKNDLLSIPYLIRRYRINIFHYWIVLGPLHNIGMGITHPCKTVATIYDLGVELWKDIPFTLSKRNTWYWKSQKFLVKQCSHLICISNTTRFCLEKVLDISSDKTSVLYCPAIPDVKANGIKREHYFFTLGGMPHKNLQRTINAFTIIKNEHPEYRMIILGAIDKRTELPDNIPDGISFEDMSRYAFHRGHSGGLVSCSIHEGFGLLPIEAIAYNCPMLLSDIPSHKETCESAACFINPYSVPDIARGMRDIIRNQSKWSEKSSILKTEYEDKTKNSGSKLFDIYKNYL